MFAGKGLALFLSLTMLLSVMAAPQQASAASMAKKSKAKYSVTVHNINSNTVLKKGQKLKIEYTATKKKGGVTTGAKVKFKSSNKKVATVSKKGVIKAKKKGTVKITVYCKAKKSKKKTVKIKVGTPVSSLKISGYRCIRVGRGSDFDASANSSATNKSVSWWSDNMAVATVNSNGYVKAKSPGTANIYATAKDGSGVSAVRTAIVHQYTVGEANWIAHRGLHTSAIENTAAAFEAAYQSGFWGCECDIWETRHETFSEKLPEDPTPEGPVPDDQGLTDPETQEGGEIEDNSTIEEDPAVTAVVDKISTLNLTGGESMIQAVEKRDVIEPAKAAYDNLNDEQKYSVRLALSNDGTEGLKLLLDSVSKIKEYDSIELAINHNSTFAEIWGNGNYVSSMSAGEIRSQLPGVCFLETFLDICTVNGRNMVPIIEIKDYDMKDEAIYKTLKEVNDRGALDKAYFISFDSSVLDRTKYIADRYFKKSDLITYYLINENGASKIDLARRNGYTGVSLSKSVITGDLYSRASSYGLGVGTWTYKDSASDDDKLYKHMIGNRWKLEFVTIDYKLFS